MPPRSTSVMTSKPAILGRFSSWAGRCSVASEVSEPGQRLLVESPAYAAAPAADPDRAVVEPLVWSDAADEYSDVTWPSANGDTADDGADGVVPSEGSFGSPSELRVAVGSWGLVMAESLLWPRTGSESDHRNRREAGCQTVSEEKSPGWTLLTRAE